MTQKVHLPRPTGLFQLATALAVTMLLAISAFQTTRIDAQTLGTGSISGTVQDSSGALVSGASVTATNVGTNAKSSIKTSGSGSYTIPNLYEGDYTVDVTAHGFADIEQQVHVEALSTVGLNISMRVGSQTEKVQISASEQPLLDTENGTVEDVIPQETYDDLPVGMNQGTKSPIAYIALSPGVTGSGTSSLDGTDSYTFNGGMGFSSQLYVNGIPLAGGDSNGGWNNLGSIITADVASFQTITSGIPAYYDGQGIGNMVYKTGTNQFHGDIFENDRNTAFDAAPYFATNVRSIEHQNEYGIAGGGPFKKNRVWFFGSYDYYKYTGTSAPALYTAPTIDEQQGIFNQGNQPIYDPTTTVETSATGCGGNPCYSRTAFPTNTIQSGRFSNAAKVLESAGLPQVSGPLTNNYGFVSPVGSQQWTEMGKTDWKITKNNTLSGLVQYDESTSLATVEQLPEPYGSNRFGPGTQWLGQLNDTQVISNNLINTAAVEFTRIGGVARNPSDGTGWTTKAGIAAGLPPGVMQGQFPMVVFSGGNVAPTAWDNGTTDFAEIPYVEVIQDNLQWIRGKHAFTFGGQLIFQYEQLNEPSAWTGGIVFSSAQTGNFCPASGVSPVSGSACTAGSVDPATGDPYASFLLGQVDGSSFSDSTVATTGGRWKNYAVWAQDDWKVTPKLTVNLGIRYSIPRPFTEAHDRWSDFNPKITNPITGTPGVVQFGGFGSNASCYCHTDVQTHYLTLGPRAGFAYSVNNKTVVRSSFAIVHFNGGLLGGNGTQQGPGVLGFGSVPSFSSSQNGVAAFILDNGYQNPTTYPGTTGNTSYTVPPLFSYALNTGYTTTPGYTSQGNAGFEYDRPATSGRSPYTEAWNLTFQRQLPSAFVVELTYAGTASHFDGMDGGVGIYSNQVSPAIFQAPGVGPLLNLPATPSNIAALQTALPGSPGLPYPNFSGTIGQMLRPFPQYGTNGPVWNNNSDSFSDFGTNSYNALQASVTHTTRNGLYLFASYAWSKEMDEAGNTIQFFEQNARSAYDWNLERSPGLSDTPQFFSFVEDYELPVGKGKLVNIDNNVANEIVGGWKLAGAEQYSAGNPFTPVVGNCTFTPSDTYGGTLDAVGLGGLNPGCYDDYNSAFSGNVKIKKIGTGDPKTDAYFDYHAFAYGASANEAASTHQLTPYSLGNTPRTLAYPSMRGEWYKNENLSITKTFPFPFFFGENASFVFRADVIDLFNRAIFDLSGGGSMNAAAGGAGSFGHVTSQENQPRFLQFEGHLRF